MGYSSRGEQDLPLLPSHTPENADCGGVQVIPSLYFLGAVVIQRRYGSMGEDVKGDYVALDSRAPNYEAEDGEVHKAADTGL
jgi:hypothetical protein